MMKKTLSVLFCITLIFTICTFSAFAQPEDAVPEQTENGLMIPYESAESAEEPTAEPPQVAEDEDKTPYAELDTKEKVTVEASGGGIFAFLYNWFGVALGAIYNLFGNFILAIFIFALAVKLLLLPLSIKQQKSQQIMARIAPKQEAIRKKYAGRNDRATQMKMQEEIQQLYADEKYNPMGGCLPLLVQFPIIIALYNAIRQPVSSVFSFTADKISAMGEFFTNHIEQFGLELGTRMTQTDALHHISKAPQELKSAFDVFMNDAGLSESLTEFYNGVSLFGGKLNLMDTPDFKSWLVVVPILVFFASFFTSKVIRKFTYNPNAGQQQEGSMKFMDWTMSLMILWFSFSVSAVVGVYWIFQNVISIGQQILLFKLFPVKAPTPEEIREAELLMKGKKSKRNVVAVDDSDDEPSSEALERAPIKKKSVTKKKKSNSPFIYARKGIKSDYLEKIREKGVAPKAKRRP